MVATTRMRPSHRAAERWPALRRRTRERRTVARSAFYLRPELAQRQLQPAAEVDALGATVGHAVLAVHLARQVDVFEPGLEVGCPEVDGDDHLAGGVAGSPQVVILVAADRLRQSVAWAKVIDRASRAIVAAPDGRARAVNRRQTVIHAPPRQPAGPRRACRRRSAGHRPWGASRAALPECRAAAGTQAA